MEDFLNGTQTKKFYPKNLKKKLFVPMDCFRGLDKKPHNGIKWTLNLAHTSCKGSELLKSEWTRIRIHNNTVDYIQDKTGGQQSNFKAPLQSLKI